MVWWKKIRLLKLERKSGFLMSRTSVSMKRCFGGWDRRRKWVFIFGGKDKKG